MAYAEAWKAVQSHTQSVEALAALGAIFGARAGESTANDAIAGKLDAVHQAIDPKMLHDISGDEFRFLRATVRANLRRALDLVESPQKPPGWSFNDPVIMQAQGRASRLCTRLINSYAERNSALLECLESPGRFLDVGSGAGWISMSLAERWANLNVHGIDIFDPALALANTNLASSTVKDRVTFSKRNVLELQERDAYDAAFLPIIFIPEQALLDVLVTMFKAIRPRGWLFVTAYRTPAEPLARALHDLQTTLWGGRVWPEEEAVKMLVDSGFEFVEDIGRGTGIHLHAARKP